MQAIFSVRRRWLLLTMTVATSALSACSGTSAPTTFVVPVATSTAATVPAVPATPPTTTAGRPTTVVPSTATDLSTTTSDPPPSTVAPEEIPERSLFVPPGAAPTIDGIIEVGEWDNAVAVSLSNGETAYWQYDEATLYVALDGSALGAVNLAVATTDELWILHSSAALGSSLYTMDGSSWVQSHGYSWCCRSANDDTARLALLEDEGWQANIGFTGDVGVVEYEVALPWGYSTAAIIYHSEDGDSAYWPTDLSEEATADIVTNRWADPAFDPGEWWMLVPDRGTG